MPLKSKRQRFTQVSSPIRTTVRIPLLPPSVNHYKKPTEFTDRSTGAVRRSYAMTGEAEAFQQAIRLFSRSVSLVENIGHVLTRTGLSHIRYGIAVTLEYGPGSRLDSDNAWKCILDGLKKAGVIHSDAAIAEQHLFREDELREKDQTTMEVWIARM